MADGKRREPSPQRELHLHPEAEWPMDKKCDHGPISQSKSAKFSSRITDRIRLACQFPREKDACEFSAWTKPPTALGIAATETTRLQDEVRAVGAINQTGSGQLSDQRINVLILFQCPPHQPGTAVSSPSRGRR